MIHRRARARLGRWLHGVVDRRVASALAGALPAFEERALARLRAERPEAAPEPRILGPTTRVRIATSARVDTALLDTRGGFVTIGDEAVVEPEAALLATAGDITVGRSAVIGARAVIVGPRWVAPGQRVPPGAVVHDNSSPHLGRAAGAGDPATAGAPRPEAGALPPELAAALEVGQTVVDPGGGHAAAIAEAVGPAGTVFAPPRQWPLDDAIPGNVHVDVVVADQAVLDGAQELLRRCRPVVVGADAPEPAPATPRPRAPLDARPWQHAEPPRTLRYTASMLSIRELGLLHWLAREHWDGRGAIVDLGSFVGGSTVALASGLAARGDGTRGRIVHAFDQFLLTGDGDHTTLRRFGWDLEPPRSVRPVFDEAIRGLGGLVEVHAGDVLEQRWHDEAIELLFVDVAKTWELNDHVTREFLPHLIAEHGILIQQDFADEWHPWVVIAMELLGDHFEWLDVVPHGSVVYRCRRPVAPGALPPRLREDLPPERLIELFDRGTNRLQGELRLVAELGAVQLLADLGRYDDARERLAASLRRGSACTRVTADAGPRVAEWLDAVSP